VNKEAKYKQWVIDEVVKSAKLLRHKDLFGDVSYKVEIGKTDTKHNPNRNRKPFRHLLMKNTFHDKLENVYGFTNMYERHDMWEKIQKTIVNKINSNDIEVIETNDEDDL
jgi:hypothetical protein